MCFQWLGVRRTHSSQFDTVHTFQVCCSGSQWVVSDPLDAGLLPVSSPEEWRELPALPAAIKVSALWIMGLPWREREKIGHKEGPLGRAESRELDRGCLGSSFVLDTWRLGHMWRFEKRPYFQFPCSIPRASPGLRMPLVCGSSVVCHPLSVPTFK